MLFVGRENEIKQICRELKLGHNIILTGKYGIGRTTLAKQIAVLLADKWRFIFVDFSLTPGKMSELLMKELGIVKRNKQTGKKFGYKSMRYRVANICLPRKENVVIVLDNVAGLTSPKRDFLRYLILEQRFQFIAITEHFLPEKDLFQMKVQLLPAAIICLRNLKAKDILCFVRLYSNNNQLNWTDTHIQRLASLAGGYPLGMVEMIRGNHEVSNSYE